MYCNVLCVVCVGVGVCVHIHAGKPHSFLLSQVCSCMSHFPSSCMSRICVRAQRNPCSTSWNCFLTCWSVYQCLLWTFSGRKPAGYEIWTTNTPQRSFFTSALRVLFPWHWQTWVLLSAIWFHCLFLYTSKLMLCQFCCQQWQKGARIHSNGMARIGIWGISRKREKNPKANCKVFFIVAVPVADAQVCLQSAPRRSRGPVMKMKQ